MNQCLGYQLFAAAGVPASRCNFAAVTVNGEELGLFAHVESVRDRFLALHFDRNEGALYEGTLSDFRPDWVNTFEFKSGDSGDDRAPLEAMVAAMEAPDAELVETLETLIDLEAFLSFWAMESLIGHWDGYAGNTNNFFLYHDPGSDLLHFIPWGIDALFFEGSSSVMAVGILARRLYLHEPTRTRYVDRVLDLLDGIWDESAILAEVDRMHGLVSGYVGPEQQVPSASAASSRTVGPSSGQSCCPSPRSGTSLCATRCASTTSATSWPPSRPHGAPSTWSTPSWQATAPST